MKSGERFALMLILLVACGTQFLFTQRTDLGTITELVTEPTGAVVANAKVTILDLATSTAHKARTNAEGQYHVFGLRPGGYEVSVTAPGMAPPTSSAFR